MFAAPGKQLHTLKNDDSIPTIEFVFVRESVCQTDISITDIELLDRNAPFNYRSFPYMILSIHL